MFLTVLRIYEYKIGTLRRTIGGLVISEFTKVPRTGKKLLPDPKTGILCPARGTDWVPDPGTEYRNPGTEYRNPGTDFSDPEISISSSVPRTCSPGVAEVELYLRGFC